MLDVVREHASDHNAPSATCTGAMGKAGWRDCRSAHTPQNSVLALVLRCEPLFAHGSNPLAGKAGFVYSSKMKLSPEAYRSSDLFDQGLGHVAICRFKGDGRVEAGFFLLDVWCLGVKDAGFEQFDSWEVCQEDLLHELFPPSSSAEPITPSAARKLVEDLVAYARALGFGPHGDYKKAARVFGGISPGDCMEEFPFGRDGKPFFIQGPNETPARVQHIIRQLEARCGKDGFDYTVAGMFEGEDDPDNFEAIEARLRELNPHIRTEINTTQAKLSNMHIHVAQPWCRGLDLDGMKMLMTLASMAWNVTLMSPEKADEARTDLRKKSADPEILKMFDLLCARAIAFYPNETRTISQVEVEPKGPSGCNVFAASFKEEAEGFAWRRNHYEALVAQAGEEDLMAKLTPDFGD